MQPLAKSLSLRVQIAPEFSDESFCEDPERTVKWFLTLAASPSNAVICSQGDAIPGLLHRLDAPAVELPCRKGSVWSLSMHRGLVIAADYYPHPPG